MRLKMHGFYEHFGNHKPINGEPYINCFNDNFCVQTSVPKNSIALLIEPRSIDKRGYEWIENHPNQYSYVFTHDSILLKKLSNAKPILYCNVWGWSDEPKTKFCSMISSDKEMCELHKIRKNLANELKDKIDCMGTFNGGRKVDTYEAHAPYMFSIVMENYIDEIWFTEKICNCFANKTIPVYYGATKIDDYFNKKGIFHVESIENIEEFIGIMTSNPELARTYYENVKDAIEDNYKRVDKYRNFERWFFETYDDLLNDLGA